MYDYFLKNLEEKKRKEISQRLISKTRQREKTEIGKKKIKFYSRFETFVIISEELASL